MTYTNRLQQCLRPQSEASPALPARYIVCYVIYRRENVARALVPGFVALTRVFIVIEDGDCLLRVICPW